MEEPLELLHADLHNKSSSYLCMRRVTPIKCSTQGEQETHEGKTLEQPVITTT